MIQWNDETAALLDKCYELAALTNKTPSVSIGDTDQKSITSIHLPDLPDEFFSMIGKLEVAKRMEEE